MKRILVIAGSDCSGGAGLEADQKVAAAHGCYAMTATTALTAQNTLGVYGIHHTHPEFVKQQIDACIDDIGVDVVKTGMLASGETTAIIATALKAHKIARIVVDPVTVSTSGSQLLPEEAIETLCKQLLPITTILTPNIPEAQLLLKQTGQAGIEIDGLDSLKRLAEALHSLGPRYVLIKGGHSPLTPDGRLAQAQDVDKVVANILYDGASLEVIQQPYQSSKNTHGTGCSLASAIACNLANGMEISRAVHAACSYVSDGIRTSMNFGKGSGPLNHFHSLQILPFAQGGFVSYLLQRQDVKAAWQAYTHHEFTNRMGDGTLPRAAFTNYMIQDYLYLVHFARATSLAGYKAKSLDEIAGAAQIVTHIRHEINLHIDECKEFGLSQAEMEAHEESQACTAYTRYVLDIGNSEDWLALQIAMFPCLLGYNHIARRLHTQQSTDPPAQPNKYLKWIENYVADDYSAAVEKGCAMIEKHAAEQSPKRIEELVEIFIHATKMETGFWNMAAADRDSRS